MNKEFIPYEQALALKELGFDEPCFAQWDEMQLYPLQQGGESAYFETNKNSRLSFNTMAPLYQQVFRWFREKYKFKFLISDDYYWITGFGQTKTESFEEAELECLVKLIEIIKEKINYA